MTSYQERPEARPSAGNAAVGIVPPPKADPVRVGTPAGSGPGDPPKRGASFWLTTLAFLILGAAALVVFFLLPGWVGGSSPTEVVPRQADLVPSTLAAVDNPPSSPSPPAKVPTQADSSSADVPAPPRPEPRVSASRHSEPPLPEPTSRDTRQAAFARAMANGLVGLDEGELEAARAAFETALTLAPGTPDAVEGLARVKAAELLMAITSRRERATAFESEERWAQAADEYSAALALDPALRFAQVGLARATTRSAMDQQLESHLARPDRLSEDAVLEQARQLLASAKRHDRPGPVLARQIDALTQAIDLASTEIRILILSDDLTNVLLYRVGELGTFKRKELLLRPGIYTVVGSRKGFRDVRRQIEVKPGPTASLTVRCEEKI